MFLSVLLEAVRAQTCGGFSLSAGRDWTVAEGCQTVTSLSSFDIPVISIDQDLTQSFPLSEKMEVIKRTSITAAASQK